MKHRGTMEHMAVMSHESCHDHLNYIHHESRPKTDGDGDWWTHIREQFYLSGSDVLRCVSETEQINCIHTHNIMSVTLQENKTNLEYTLDRPGPARGQTN